MSAKVTILGCGNSSGVPAIGNRWGNCDPNEPKNNRTRSSIAVQTVQTTLIVDTGPDFRQQLNRSNITDINGVLYTHAHGDHIHGIDELRVFSYSYKDLIKVYGNSETLQNLQNRFSYMFKGGKLEIYPPLLEVNEITDDLYGQELSLGGIKFTPFPLDHGSCTACGYRFGNLGYCLDMLNMSDQSIEILKGCDILIMDGAGYKDNENLVHASLEKVFAINEEICAKRVIISSLSVLMDYQTLVNELPEGYEPAYDGLEVDIELNT